jgi:hypothetical protein
LDRFTPLLFFRSLISKRSEGNGAIKWIHYRTSAGNESLLAYHSFYRKNVNKYTFFENINCSMHMLGVSSCIDY